MSLPLRQVDLYTLCRGLVFQCAVEALFGRAFVAALPELLLGSPSHAGLFKDHAQGPTTDDLGAEQEGDGGTGDTGVSAISALALGLAHEAERGRRALPGPPAGVQRLARTFDIFEEGFEVCEYCGADYEVGRVLYRMYGAWLGWTAHCVEWGR